MSDKIPYLNRLFKNVAIVGNAEPDDDHMSTPRIIIQEEEEEKLGITSRSGVARNNSKGERSCAVAASPQAATALFFLVARQVNAKVQGGCFGP